MLIGIAKRAASQATAQSLELTSEMSRPSPPSVVQAVYLSHVVQETATLLLLCRCVARVSIAEPLPFYPLRSYGIAPCGLAAMLAGKRRKKWHCQRHLPFLSKVAPLQRRQPAAQLRWQLLLQRLLQLPRGERPRPDGRVYMCRWKNRISLETNKPC